MLLVAVAALSLALAASNVEAAEQNVPPLTLGSAQGTLFSHDLSAVPVVAGSYVLRDTAESRVHLVQEGMALTATWMNPDGSSYGRGTYHWDDALQAFVGTSTTQFMCLSESGEPPVVVTHPVRERLSVDGDELVDAWTKPMAVDCPLGIVRIFKWTERRWRAADAEAR